MILELIADYPMRRRFLWRADGYAAKLRRAWAAGEQFRAERDAARAELARERAAVVKEQAKSAELARQNEELEAQLAQARRVLRPRKTRVSDAG